MSFIFEDDKLIEQLISSATNFNMKFAQTAAGTDPNSAFLAGQTANLQRVYDLANRLAIDLQRKLNDDTAPPAKPPVSSALNADSNLNISNVRTLGDFIGWLADNKMTWNGKRFAWRKDGTFDAAQNQYVPGEDEKEALNSKAYLFQSLPLNRNFREAGTRQPENIENYALKPELTSYLSYLRDKEVPKVLEQDAIQGKVFEVVVKNLIGELNKLMPVKERLPVKAKGPGSEVSFDPGTIVDALPDSTIVLDANNRDMRGLEQAPFVYTNARAPLRISDLENQGRFSEWVSYMRIKKQDGSVVNVMDPNNGDPCSVLYVLYSRALYLKNIAIGKEEVKPGYSKMVEKYMNAVLEFGKNFRDPKTQGACAITAPGVTGTKDDVAIKPDDKNKTTGVGSQESYNANIVRMLPRFIDALPLDLDDISFDRINTFFRLLEGLYNYNNLDSERRTEFFKSKIADAKSAMEATREFVNPNISVFPVRNIRVGVVNSWLKQDKKPELVRFINSLQTVLTETQLVIKAFEGAYKPQLRQYPDALEKITLQVNEIFNDNWRNLSGWKSDALNVRIK